MFNRLRIAFGILTSRDGYIGFRAYKPLPGVQLYDAAGAMDSVEMEHLANALIGLSDEVGGRNLLTWAKGVASGDEHNLR